MGRWMACFGAVVVGCATDQGPEDTDQDGIVADHVDRVVDPDAWCPKAVLSEVDASIDETLAGMALPDKIARTHGTGITTDARGLWLTAPDPAHDVVGLRLVDGPRGVASSTGPATAFPVGALRGATFDPVLERRVGEAMGAETAGKAGHGLLAPTINVLRHPRWGRAQETYGEDPHHLGVMGAAFVQGVQEHVAAVPKHFVANSIEATRFDVDVTVDEVALHEVYLPAFHAVVVDGRAASVMSAYNFVNGQHASENGDLLRGVLKEGWGFPGFVVSDWVFGTRGAVGAATGGLDLEMPFGKVFGDGLAEAVAAGEVDEATIDAMVRRILRVERCFASGEVPEEGDPALVGTADHLALAQEVAERGVVLLTNDGTLPLPRAGTLVVTGALADSTVTGDQGSSKVLATRVITLLDGLIAGAGDAAVVHIPPEALADRAAEVAAADAVIVAVGTTDEEEGEGLIAAGDRIDLRLPERDRAVLAALADQDHVVVVLHGGSVFVPDDWREVADASLAAFYPGQEGGTALARLIFGDVAPSGRLPSTWPEREADLPPFDNESLAVTYDAWHGYAHQQRAGVEAAFPFGWGLTYGEVSIAEVSVEEASLAPDAPAAVTVSLRNEGARELHQTVFAFLTPPGEDGRMRLVAFENANVEAGSSRDVAFTLPPEVFTAWSPGIGWVRTVGPWTLRIGTHAEDAEHDVVLQVLGDTRGAAGERDAG